MTVETFPRGPRPFDVAAALGGLALGLLLWAVGLDLYPRRDVPGWWVLVPLAVTAGLELLRRVRPLTGLAVGCVALVADQLTTGSLATVLLFTDLVYAAAVYGSARLARRLPVAAGALTLAAVVWSVVTWRDAYSLMPGLGVGLIVFGPAATGALVRHHRDAARAARREAERTARLAELDRAQAVTAERTRMARELHDVIAGHLSAVAVHSTAALSLDDADTSRRALGVIRENSVAALTEMRRLIGLLRAGGEDLEPSAAPTLESLPPLAEGVRAAGFAVTLDLGPGLGSGPDAGAGRVRLPSPVELAAYRIVQESLTNVLKHAAPGPVTVALRLDGGALRVEVTSAHGTPDGQSARAPGAGAGLIGMRERAVLVGGGFEAGPEDGRWVVRAHLPVPEGEGMVP
ncbi:MULTISPECIES: sensor histidine kinase [Streptomyces]|uniref:histidine kinase n=1 Tax=Streptomyces chilikensis TaxID=1194079 RepID=A0ABV3EX43_9ACTN|nr:histidine kinase [Streptomyces sp. MJP52]MDH6224940.1 signal transduction histidine kinase [Streptomyces sp. MJP52]